MPFPIVLAGTLAALLGSQAPAPAWLKPASRVSAEASIEEPRKDGAPNRVVVSVNVTPAPGIHVYAPGNKDYVPVEVSLVPQPGVTPGKAEYPPSQPLVFGELDEVVQVYAKPFRIRVPIALQAGPTRPRAVRATLRYQACTDRVCYPPATLPIEVALPSR
jgi:DsbC/DsbD-like thiol-disulfide interchange protein